MAVTVGNVVLWTSVRIRIGAKTFETTLETVTVPAPSNRHSALLTKLFADPSPIFDEVSGMYHFPEKLCSDPAVFDFVLDFLRTGGWLPIQNRRLNEDVCRLAGNLGLRDMPAPVMDLGPMKFEYMELTIPHRPSLKEKMKQRRRLLEQLESGRLGGGGGGTESNNDSDGGDGDRMTLMDNAPDSCATLAALAERGFRVVGERSGRKLETGHHGGISALPSTIVSLERRYLASLPLISQLAVVSPWFLTLSQCL